VSHVKTSGGNIVLNVPGNAIANDNLTLATAGSLNAPAGTITLNVGGNLTISSGSTVSAESAVNLSGDFQNKSAGTGSVFDIDSAIQSPNVAISGGRQGEAVNLRATASVSKVTINLPSGTNTINIGSSEPSPGGVLANIQGAVNVVGSRSTTLNLDDSGSRTALTGTLTSSALTGFKLSKSGIAYSGLGALNIVLGTRDKLAEKSKASGTTTTITGGTVTPSSATRAVIAAPQAGTNRPGGNAQVSIAVANKAPAALVSYSAGNGKPRPEGVDSVFQDSSGPIGLTTSGEDLEGMARMLVKKNDRLTRVLDARVPLDQNRR
jgi:hypothetical protein